MKKLLLFFVFTVISSLIHAQQDEQKSLITEDQAINIDRQCIFEHEKSHTDGKYGSCGTSDGRHGADADSDGVHRDTIRSEIDAYRVELACIAEAIEACDSKSSCISGVQTWERDTKGQLSRARNALRRHGPSPTNK